MNWTSAIYSLILPSGSIIFAWAIFQPPQSPTQPLLPNRSSTRIAWKNKYEYTCRNEWKYGWWGEQVSWKDERTVHPILEYYPSYLSTSNKNGRSILSITKFLLLNNQTIISGNDDENTKKNRGEKARRTTPSSPLSEVGDAYIGPLWRYDYDDVSYCSEGEWEKNCGPESISQARVSCCNYESE